jgi:HlyD family secretion protein
LIEPGSEDEGGGNCCIDVRAPVSGRILKVMRKSQGVVAAGTGLVEIGNPEDLEVVVDFLSTDAVKIEPGATVIIDEWGGDDTLNALVRRVEPYGFTKISALGIEEQRVNVVIEFAENPERLAALGHGYRVEARVVIWRGADVVKVPINALFRVGGRWAVFVDDNGTAREVTVEIGHMNTVEAEVLDGLTEGTEVVLHPSDRVVDGALITPRPNSHQG